MKILPLLLVLALLTGCAQPASEPIQPEPEDPFLRVLVLDLFTEGPIQGIAVQLVDGLGARGLLTNAAGIAFFQPVVGPTCQIVLEREGERIGEAEVSCLASREVTIRLEQGSTNAPLVDDRPITNPRPSSTSSSTPTGPGRLLTIHNALPGAPTTGSVALLDASGALHAYAPISEEALQWKVPEGTYRLVVSHACGYTEEVQVDGPTDWTLRAPTLPALPAVTGLVAAPGPGPASVALRWDPVLDSVATQPGHAVPEYRVYRDGERIATVGTFPTHLDQGNQAGGTYQVQTAWGCAPDMPGGATVTAMANPLPLVSAPTVSSNVGSEPEFAAYPRFNADGEQDGSRAWRILTEVGNCCESFGYTGRDGTIYEYGGSVLHVSKDGGRSWVDVSNVAPALGAEGAMVGAPGGDILAINWDPYTGDQLWSHKYIANEDRWYTSRAPIHQPFFDRPWVGVLPGPFELEGQIVPYVSLFISNYVHGGTFLVSYDGLTYLTSNVLDTSTLLSGTIDPLRINGEMDWIQAMQETDAIPLSGGGGLRERGLVTGCPFSFLDTSLTWVCPGGLIDTFDSSNLLRDDGRGNLHRLVLGAGQVEYSRYDAQGEPTVLEIPVPGGHVLEEIDFVVQSSTDQAVILMHASDDGTGTKPDVDYVVRIRGILTEPFVDEILQVGLGDHVFGGGLTSAYDRFDYVTLNLTPDGRIVTTFGDSSHVPPTIAIEMGA